MFYSKVSRDTLYEAVETILNGSKEKPRKFLETIELQISLKNYDPQKDKRFSGTVKYVLFSYNQSIQNLIGSFESQMGWNGPSPRVLNIG